MSTVVDTTTAGLEGRGQSYSMVRIWSGFGSSGPQVRIRTTVHHDSSYPNQSRNRAELWTDHGWVEVCAILGEDDRSVRMASGYGLQRTAVTASAVKMTETLLDIAQRTLGMK